VQFVALSAIKSNTFVSIEIFIKKKARLKTVPFAIFSNSAFAATKHRYTLETLSEWLALCFERRQFPYK